jgi:hypothetical protein
MTVYSGCSLAAAAQHAMFFRRNCRPLSSRSGSPGMMTWDLIRDSQDVGGHVKEDVAD